MISPHLRHALASGVSYDDATALHLAEFAQAVYGEPQQFYTAAKRAGYHDIFSVNRGATQAGVAVTERGVVNAWRGSQERIDWRENAQIWRVGWWARIPKPSVGPGQIAALAPRVRMIPEGCRVHRGHLRQYMRTHEELCEGIHAALGGQTKGVPFFPVGHSLGGGVATFSVPALIAELGLRLEAFYTFEAPRPGNKEFSEWWAKLYGSVSHRVAVVRRGATDLVTRLPPAACGWWHIGRPQMIVGGQRIESEAAWEEARKKPLPGDLPQWRLASRLVSSIKAHDMAGLLLTLRTIYGRGQRLEAQPVEVPLD